MASADLRDELDCSICLGTYTDPVMLRCGHNFCRVCIDLVLDTQDKSGDYFCPDCREEFQERPALQRNITLRNVAERFRSSQPHQKKITGICCTYCLDCPVLAVKSCLHCEAYLCDNHLRVHSKGPEHVLTDPSTSLENRKCPVHKKILGHYSTEDAACICFTCHLTREHRGHQLKMQDCMSQQKNIRNILQKLSTKREKIGKRVQSFEERWRRAQEKASGEAERVIVLFIDFRRRVDDLEKKLLSEISRQEEKMSLSMSDVIQKLEIKKDELSRKMRHIEQLCNMTDPLTILQEPDTSDLCDPEEDGGDEDTGGHDGGDEDTGEHDTTYDVDVEVIAGMLHEGFSDIITYLQTISPAKLKGMRPPPLNVQSLPSDRQNYPISGINHGGDDVIVRSRGDRGNVTPAGKKEIDGENTVDILLDVNTAGSNLLISDDLKTATWTGILQYHPETAERFPGFQVMSSQRFTSGRHYWDVEIRRPFNWSVGMCYPSVDRGGHSSIGYNNKSWGLYGGWVYNNQCSVIHDNKYSWLPHQISSDRFRICLDYEAGQLSFYELCDPIRHLHTFTATFTEPLLAVLAVCKGSIKISGGTAAVRNQPCARK